MGISLEQWDAIHAQGVGVTNTKPLSLVAFGIAAASILAGDRTKALMAFLCMAFWVPYTQKIAVAGVSFFLIRILILLGLCRLVVRSEYFPVKPNMIDKTMFFYLMVLSIANILLWQDTSTVIYRVGQLIDILGGYILLRSFIRDMKDIDNVIRLFVIISAIIAICMLFEYYTSRNLFYLLGADEISGLRDGRVRCSGPFSHPILAGTFGVLIFPLFLYLWSRNLKIFAVLGIASSLIMIFTASSSTPVLAFLAAVIGLSLFPLRKYMRTLRWGSFFLLIALHFYMKASVWALISRISPYESSSSYQRYLMMDQFIARFPEWFLVGTKSTAHWGHESEQMFDITNGYVQAGVEGGVLTLLLLIILIVLCFSSIGKAMTAFGTNKNDIFLIWVIGVMLFTHLVSFIGVAYFGQMFVTWILTIIMISVIKDVTTGTKNSNIPNIQEEIS